jgi:hypothetical protein
MHCTRAHFVLQKVGPDVLPLINLLFAGRFDLIIGHITQMARGLLVLNAAQGRNLDQIFVHKLPKIRETED